MKELYLLVLLLMCIVNYAQEPSYEWVQNIGNTSLDQGLSIVVDSEGNSYSTGVFNDSVDFDMGPDEFYLTPNGATDIYIQKLDPNGELIWAKNVGGSSTDFSRQIAINEFNEVYITGQFRSNADFDPSDDEFILSSNGDVDIFILKLNSDGEFEWAKSMGAEGRDEGTSLTLDNGGNVIITGDFEETVDFDPSPSESYFTSNGEEDLFVLKLNADGDYIWCQTIGSSHNDYGSSIDSDEDDNLYIVGHYQHEQDFNTSDEEDILTPTGVNDIFLLKLDESGEFILARTIGGAIFETGERVEIDPDGNIIMVGCYNGAVDFDLGEDVFELESEGELSIFILKMNASTELIWAKSIQASSSQNLTYDVEVDGNRDIYLTGEFENTMDFDPDWPTYNLTSLGGSDIYILKLDEFGNFVWAEALGGTFFNRGVSIALFELQSIYLTGYFAGSCDFDPDEDNEVLLEAFGGASPNSFTLKLGPHDLGDEELDPELKLIIYPNPAKSTINIELHNSGLFSSFKIYDLTGRVIIVGELSNDNSIPIEQLSNGIYILELPAKNGTISSQFIKY